MHNEHEEKQLPHRHQWGPWIARKDYYQKGILHFRYERGCRCGAEQQTSDVKSVGRPRMTAEGSL